MVRLRERGCRDEIDARNIGVRVALAVREAIMEYLQACLLIL